MRAKRPFQRRPSPRIQTHDEPGAAKKLHHAAGLHKLFFCDLGFGPGAGLKPGWQGERFSRIDAGSPWPSKLGMKGIQSGLDLEVAGRRPENELLKTVIDLVSEPPAIAADRGPR